MKVAITAKGKYLDSDVDLRFSRCKTFIIYNTDTDEYECLHNKGYFSPQVAVLTTTQIILDYGVDVLISGYIEPTAYYILSDAKVKIYCGTEGPVIRNVQKLLEGKLLELLSLNKRCQSDCDRIQHRGLSECSTV